MLFKAARRKAAPWCPAANPAVCARASAKITPGTNGAYQARFHARYGKFPRFSFGYTLALEADEVGPTMRFHGGADLGWLAGGMYHCTGEATATNLHATYQSKYDHGTFEMSRPVDEKTAHH